MSLDRTKAPPFSLSADYSLTQPEVFVSPGGQLCYFFRGLGQNVAKLDLVFKAGKWYEPASGVSYFTAQMLRQGTRSRSSFDIAEDLDRLGAHLEVTAGFDTVTFSLFVLSKNLFDALAIFLDIVHHPAFPEDELRQEKDIFVENLRVNNEKTSVLASRELRKALFGALHPYGNSTEETDANRITSPNLSAFFLDRFEFQSAYFIGPLEDKGLHHLLDLLTFASDNKSPMPKPVTQPGGSHHLPKEGSVQASIRLGKLCLPMQDHADYYNAMLANHILGGFFGSRLMKNIREEKGLTYGIYSAMQHLQNASYWVIGAEVNQQNASQALEEIRKEILSLQSTPVPDDELKVARNYFIGSWQSDNATLFAVADKIRGIHEFRLPPDYYARMFTHLMAMTPSDVQAAARKHFTLEELVEIRVG